MQEILSKIGMKKEKKFLIELVLIGCTIVCIFFTGYFIYIYNYQIGFWFILPFSIFIILIILGIYENKIFKPDWIGFSIDILKELKQVNVLKISNYIRDSQSFIGSIYIHSSILLDIYDDLIKEKIINAEIIDLNVELIN